VRRLGLAKRVAAIERAKAPPRTRQVTGADGRAFHVEAAPGVGIWPPWHQVLTDQEWILLDRLLRRRPRPRGGPWPNWRDEYRSMCRGGVELAVLEGIFAKEPPGQDSREAYPSCALRVMLLEFAVTVPEEEDDAGDEPAPAR
jgi:hypothetical protein